MTFSFYVTVNYDASSNHFSLMLHGLVYVSNKILYGKLRFEKING